MNQATSGNASRKLNYKRLSTISDDNSEPENSTSFHHSNDDDNEEMLEDIEPLNGDFRRHSTKSQLSLASRNFSSSRISLTENAEDGKQDLMSTETVLFFTISYLLGMAMIETPFIFRYVGWTGAGVIILVALITGYTAYLTMKSFVDVQFKQPSGYISYMTPYENNGSFRENFLAVLFMLYLILTSVTVLTDIARILVDVTKTRVHLEKFASTSASRVATSAIGALLFPLTLLKSPKKYPWFATILLVTTVLAGLLLTTLLGNLERRNPPYKDLQGIKEIDYATRIATGICNLVRFFGLHAVISTIVADMKDPLSAPKVVVTGFIIPTIFVVIVAMMTYFAFGENIKPDLLFVIDQARARNPNTFATISTITVKGLLSLQMCGIYLLTVNTLNLYFESKGLSSENNICHCCLLRIFTTTIVILFAVAASKITTVLTLVNTILACFLCVIHPLIASINSKISAASLYIFHGTIIFFVTVSIIASIYNFVASTIYMLF